MRAELSDQCVSSALEYFLGYPFITGNTVTRLLNGDQIFSSMLNGIRSAERTIELLTFVYWEGEIADQFADALASQAKAGIQVRVVLDAVGARQISDENVQTMLQSGVNLQWFRPLASWKIWSREHRTHRKILVVDGTTGFTGGVGIAEEWCGDARSENEWRDTHFKITGPAVKALIGGFYGNWAETGQRVLNPDDQLPINHAVDDESVLTVRATASTGGWSDISLVFDLLIATCNARLWVTTAYFVPNQATCKLLIEAVERGVDVQIMMPGQYTDERVSQVAGEDTFQPLIEAGIRLWKYEKTMLHVKSIIADDEIACIGSANFNQRSISKDDEIALIVKSPQLVSTLANDFENDLEQCRQIQPDDWKKRGLFQRMLEFAGRMVRPHT